MPSSPARRARPVGALRESVDNAHRWKLEDAKARLSEVVRLAGTEGPQLVTVRGKEAAVIVAPEQFRQLLPKAKGHRPLVSFLRSLRLSGLDLQREIDTGREIDL